MNASYSWIRSYVPDLSADYKEFADAMTLSGTKVESFKVYDENLKDIVCGKILSIEKHPDADKLVVCRVDVGKKEPVQIVTGAPNVSEGAMVPVVLAGGKVAGMHGGEAVPEGVEIKEGKLRGVESCGMLCSVEELGATKEMYPDAPEDGIYIFKDDENLMPGDDAIEALGLHDALYEFEITSNRVDCYSVTGLAREAAATFKKDFIMPVFGIEKETEDINDYLKIDIEDKELCPRYTARMIKNLRIATSPEWLQRRLANSGIRPINNIVDITNYVMEEYGQPMHAFNYDAIKGQKIIVKRAKNGDKFTTLDGQERELDNDVLMICDNEEYIGIAGIMGGEDSKITDDVKNVIFESATFDGTNNRLAAKRLGLRTDASGKFEKGLDPENTIEAINRACQLVEMLDAGDVVGGVIDIYPEKNEKRRIKFEPERINTHLGTDISKEEMLGFFKPLSIEYDEKDDMLTIPTFRQDLISGCDIAEEVARFYGYDNIPTSFPKGAVDVFGGLSENLVTDNKIREILCGYGFSESMTYSFESPKVFDMLHLDADDKLRNVIRINNPLGEDYSIMRTSLINGLLLSLSTNYNRRNKEAALFEFSNVYIPDADANKLPDERMTLAVGAYGNEDFYSVKGLIEDIFDKLDIGEKRIYKNEKDLNFLHPGRQAKIYIKDILIGFLGQIHPFVAKNYELSDDVVLAQIDIKTLYNMKSETKKYKPVPRYPAVSRDLSLVMSSDIPAGDVESVIYENGSDLLENIELFDVYEGNQIEEGHKSLAYSIRFRAKDRTLEDKEINVIMDEIIKNLEEKGIKLRS